MISCLIFRNQLQRKKLDTKEAMKWDNRKR
jgi:hypothetical protein